MVSLSRGAQYLLELARLAPERVAGAAFIGPMFPYTPSHWSLLLHPLSLSRFQRPFPLYRWWGHMNAVHWREDYPEFAEWFISRCFPEPHSSKAHRGRRGMGAGYRSGDADRHGGRQDPPRAAHPARAGGESGLPGAGRPRRPRQDHASPGRQGAGPPRRRTARGRPRRRPLPARPQAGSGQPGAARLLRGRPRAAAHAAGPHRPPPRRPSPRPLCLLTDRARPRPARRGDRTRAAPPAPGPADRLARPGPGHPGACGGGRAHPPSQRSPGQRVPPHRVGVRRARPALLPRAAPHGRDPRRQLHALPRRRRATSATTSGSGTRRGSSTTTCTRTRARSASRSHG